MFIKSESHDQNYQSRINKHCRHLVMKFWRLCYPKYININKNSNNNNHTNKWYVHNLESVLENETYKILWDFEINMDHLITARQPDIVIINKKKWEPAK